MFNGATLSIIEESAESVLILAEDVEDEALLASRLTRQEIQRLLATVARGLADMGPDARQTLPELDWEGWIATGREILTAGPQQDQALLYAVQSLVPATIMWLRVYKQNQPDLFRHTP